MFVCHIMSKPYINGWCGITFVCEMFMLNCIKWNNTWIILIKDTHKKLYVNFNCKTSKNIIFLQLFRTLEVKIYVGNIWLHFFIQLKKNELNFLFLCSIKKKWIELNFWFVCFLVCQFVYKNAEWLVRKSSLWCKFSFCVTTFILSVSMCVRENKSQVNVWKVSTKV